MLKWLLLASFGRLLIHLIQRFPLPEFLGKFHNLEKWKRCNLCSGVWIYSILAAILGVDLLSIWFSEIGVGYILVLGEILTGTMTSWILYIFEIGLREEYFNITIIE